MNRERRTQTPSGIPGGRALPPKPDPASAPVAPEDQWTNEGGTPPPAPSKK